MNAEKWIKDIINSEAKKALPILSFPGIQIINKAVSELVADGALQAKCMKAVADRYDMLAAVTLMDLSVESEAFGSPVAFSDDEVPTVTNRIVENLEDAETLKVPEIGAGRTSEYIKTVSEAKKLITDRPVLAGALGPYSLAGRLLDLTEIMILSMTEPEIVHAVLEKVVQFSVSYVREFKKAGADGVIFAEPAAGLLSPELNREFSVKYMQRMAAELKSDDFFILYHNCGNNTPALIQDIIKIGAHAIHLGNAVKLDEMIPLIPENILVMGNVDPVSQFRNGTPESIAANTLEILEKCSKYKNYVPSSGCDIPPLAPLANIDAYFAAVREFYKK